MATFKQALCTARLDIFITDQGGQSMSEEFTGTFAKASVRINMDGRGRALDIMFTERLWRSVMYEDGYLRDYADGFVLCAGLARYFWCYNHKLPHSGLHNETLASGNTGK